MAAIAITQETLLCRLDRLENMLKELEELRGFNRASSSPKTSGASTPSSGTFTSEGQPSSVDFSPKSLEKLCRPIDRVVMETEIKGTLIDRLDNVEGRVMKLCLQLEAEMGTEKQAEEKTEKRVRKKGLKGIVNKIVKGGNRKHKSEQ